MSFYMDLHDREEPPLSQEELRVCEDLKSASKIEDINMSETDVDYKSLDDYLFLEEPPKTLIGLTVEKALGGWPGNRVEVVSLLKKQIEKGADLTRALVIESKKDPPDNLKILLEIIFSESILASEPEAENDKKLEFEEIAAKAANDKSFRWVIGGLHQYYIHNEDKSGSDQRYKTLEAISKKLQLRKFEANPYFRSLKWLLETCRLFKDDNGNQVPIRHQRTHRVRSQSPEFGDYEETPGREESNVMADDIFLGTLQFISDIRDERPATDFYLKTEYQHLSDQAEKFAVALLEEVRDERELSTVIKMEDKFSEGVADVFEDRVTTMREGIEKVSLIQHAINLRCKYFVVSKNCQHLLKDVIFGRTIYRFWDDPRVKTGAGMPSLLILSLKVVLGLLCGAFMTLFILPYVLVSLANCLMNKHFCKGFLEWYERPCQKYLFELCWFMVFLSMVIITSTEDNFRQNNLSSGLTKPDIFLFLFVAAFWLRLLTFLYFHVQTLMTIPRYRRNWRILLPDILTAVECASLLCFTIAFVLWIIRWHMLGRWRPFDDKFQTVDVFYSLGSLLCFFKLAHYLKAEYTLGTLNLSLYMMITKDVTYFAIIFVILLFVPFATALKKMYSYYVVDNLNNSTQPLASYSKVYDDLLWTMLGSDEKKDIEISDSYYGYIKQLGETCIAVFTVAAVVVAFNMLVATMNHTYENIMKNVDMEYVFSRTRMWIEYIATDHSALPPPLNLADFIKCCCRGFCKARKKPPGNYELLQKMRDERISIIKRLVFRYLRRCLKLDQDSTEYFQDVFTQNSSSLEHGRDPSHPIQEV